MESAPSCGLVIRDATEADVAAITAIYAPHVMHGSASFEEIPPDVGEMQRRFPRDPGLGPALPRGERDARVVGYAYAGPYRTRPAYRFTLEDSVYVGPADAGQGVGSRLLAALVDRCRAGP